MGNQPISKQTHIEESYLFISEECVPCTNSHSGHHTVCWIWSFLIRRDVAFQCVSGFCSSFSDDSSDANPTEEHESNRVTQWKIMKVLKSHSSPADSAVKKRRFRHGELQESIPSHLNFRQMQPAEPAYAGEQHYGFQQNLPISIR